MNREKFELILYNKFLEFMPEVLDTNPRLKKRMDDYDFNLDYIKSKEKDYLITILTTHYEQFKKTLMDNIDEPNETLDKWLKNVEKLL